MMEMRVKVMNPTGNNKVEVDIPDDMTVQDVINDLIEAGFIPNNQQGYDAVLKDGTETIQMDLNKTLVENNVTNDAVIQLLNGTQAGGCA